MTPITIEKLTEIVLEEVRISSPASGWGDGQSKGALDHHLKALAEWKDCRRRTSTGSHRARAGFFVNAAKKAFRTVFSPFIRDSLETQTRFNEQVWATFETLNALVIEERSARQAAVQQAEALRTEFAEHRKFAQETLRSLRQRVDRNETARQDYAELLQRLRTVVESDEPEERVGAVIEDVVTRADSTELAYARFHTETSSTELSKQIYEQYLPYFRSCRRVADLGCGNGPFLTLLKEHGIDAYGVDADPILVKRCRDNGLDVHEADLLEHLDTLDDASIDGVFVGHVIEHLETSALVRLFERVWHVLAPGGVFVFESPNTENLLVLSHTYFRDPTHQLPRHPETYRHLAEAAGFVDIEMLHSLPAEESYKFRDAPATDEIPAGVRDAWNWNSGRLNEFFFGYANFSIACRRGGGEDT